MKSNNLKILKFIFQLFLTWRIVILLVTFLGLSYLPHIGLGEERKLSWPNSNVEYWVRWANWDGGHFRGIAENGYLPHQSVFLPLYPLLIKFFMLFGLSSFWAGFLVSNVSTIVLLYYLYKLALLEFGEKIAVRVIYAILIFPTAFYLGSVYSEALFLALTVSSFYYMKKGNYLIASILAGFSSITRITGIAVIVALFIDYLIKNNNSPFNLKEILSSRARRAIFNLIAIIIFLNVFLIFLQANQYWFLVGSFSYLIEILIPIFLLLIFINVCIFLIKNIEIKKLFNKNFVILFISIVPLSIYTSFQVFKTNNPLFFLHSYSNWNIKLSFPWEAPLGYFKYILARGVISPGGAGQTLSEFLFFLVLLITFLFALNKLKKSYTVYIFTAFLITLISGTLVGFPRHSLSIFPIFFIFAFIENDLIQKALVITSIAILGLFSVIFINNYWIS